MQSNNLKTDALRYSLDSYNTYKKKFIYYHKKNNSISRYEKIDYFCKNFLNDKIRKLEKKLF